MGSSRCRMSVQRAVVVSWLAALQLGSCHRNTKALTVTDDAYILDVDLPDKSSQAAPSQSRFLSSGNSAVDGAVVGLGVGILGSLLLSKLQEKKRCNQIIKRDTASSRFLPGILSSDTCPPPYNPGYNQHQQHSGYRPNNGYQQHNTGYNGYQQQNTGYQQLNTGYNGYQQTNNGYNGFQQPNNGYNGYQQPNNGYNGYLQTSSVYSPVPVISYNQPYRTQSTGGYSQSRTHKPTPAPFLRGLPSRYSRHGLTKSR